MADYVVSATLVDGISDPANAATAAMQALGDAADNTAASVTKVGPSAQALAARLDPATQTANAYQKALQNLTTQSATLSAGLATGKISQDQYQASMTTLQQKVASARDAMAATAPAVDALTGANAHAAAAATGAAGAHAGFYREIVILGHEALTGNYSRIPGSMAVLAERTGNLSGIMSTLGSIVFGWPGLFAVGIGALALLGVEAESQQRKLLGLQTALMATRTDYQAMGQEALNAAKAVASSTGFSSADSLAATKDIASVPSFQGTGDQLAALVRTAGDLSVVMGQTLPQAAETLAKAMQDPGAEAETLAKDKFPGMTQAIADSIVQMANAGDKAGAFNLVLQTVQNQVGDAAKASKTELQLALSNLSDSFVKTGADGKSFSQVLGENVVQTAVAAVDAINGLVNAFNHARETVTAGEAAQANGGTPGSPGGVTGAGGYAGTTGRVLTSSAGALGIFQLMPQTAAGLGVNPMDASQNVYGGLAYIQQLSKQFSGDPSQILAQYGGYGSNVSAAQPYIDKVNGANTSALNGQNITVGSQTMTVAQAVEFWGQTLGLPQNMIQLGMQIATVESGGHQYQNANPALSQAVADTAGISTIGASDSPNSVAGSSAVTNGSGVVNSPQGTVDDALRLADGMNTTSTAAQKASDDVKLLQTALQQLIATGQAGTPQYQVLNEALEKSESTLYNAVPAVQAAMRATQQQIDQQSELAQAYQAGYGAVQNVNVQFEAQAAALKDGVTPNMQNYAVVVAALAGQFNSLATATAEASAAKATAANQDQLQYIQAETDSLGQDNTQRQVMLAGLQTEQKLRAAGLSTTDQYAQGEINSAKAVAQASAAYQQQQAALSDLSNAFTSAFDTIGNAMAQAFVQGQGAAVNWANVMDSVIEQVIQEFLKLAVLNPILNSLFGTNSTTLGGVFTALGAVSSGGNGVAAGSTGSGTLGLLENVGGLATNSSLLNALGITGQGGLLDSVGLTGSNGLLSGLSGSGNLLGSAYNGILGVLNTPLYGGTAITGATSDLGGIASSAADTGALTSGVSTGAIGATTIGTALAGVGLGFGAGSLVGGLIANSPSKQQNSEIGAGGGALTGAAIGSIVPGLGTVIGGLIGGLIGGVGGGLIGGPKPNAYSSTDVMLQPGGLLATGGSDQQLDGSTATSTSEDATTINEALIAANAFLTSIGGVQRIGQNTPGGFQDPAKASSLSAAFPGFRFGSGDPTLNTYLNGKSYGSLQDLETDLGQYNTLVTSTIPALDAFNTSAGSLAPALANINNQFNPAIAAAQKYGIATAQLTAAQNQAIQTVNDQVNATVAGYDNTFKENTLTAAAQISGNPADQETADLFALDFSVAPAQAQLKSELEAIYGTSYDSTAAYADQMAQLESSLGEQRLAIQAQFNDKLIQSAQSAISSLGGYASSLEFGSGSLLTPAQQYALASSQFQTTAAGAAGGNFDDLSNLQNAAQTFLSASSTVNGSGAQFTADNMSVINALSAVGNIPQDVLTNGVLASETQTQTQQLSTVLMQLLAATKAITTAIGQNGLQPSRITQ